MCYGQSPITQSISSVTGQTRMYTFEDALKSPKTRVYRKHHYTHVL